MDGKGEDAGIICIHNSVIVFAYGGAGGGTNKGIGYGAGIGGGGYPAARNRTEEELAVAGGDHAAGAGGYSGGGGQAYANLYDSDNGSAVEAYPTDRLSERVILKRVVLAEIIG